MSAGGEELLTEEQQRLVDEAADRVRVLLEGAQYAAYQVTQAAAEEADQIRRQVLEAVGVEIIAQPPGKLPAVHDVRLGDLAELAVSCRHLLAGVDLLAPHVQHGSARTVGAIVKTSVDAATGAAALTFLNRAGFYAPEEGTT